MTSLLLLTALVAAPPKADATGIEFFEKKIRPVLVAQCYECHSAKSKIVQANLYLDTREGTRRGGDSGPAVVPNEIDESLLVEAIRYEGYEMPPKGKLPEAVIADFVKWIEMGAPDPRDGAAPTVKTINVEAGRKFWSFQPPKLTPPSPVKNAAWAKSEIDRYVLAAQEAKNLQPAPDADPVMLLRRLSFDLTGLPPTPDMVVAFESELSQSPSPPVSSSPVVDLEAFRRGYWEREYAAIVDKFLASPQFGERWGRHWLDVARYAESSGKERNVPYRMAWRYRDYVIDALNADLPYDAFIREQIAGDLLESKSVAERDRRLIATGFLAIGPQALTERVEEQFLIDVADEQLDTTCRAFLASTAACARCHDHKFDPIPTTDYYALIGIFRSSENIGGVRPLRREFSYTKAMPLGDEKVRTGASRELQELIGKLERELDLLRNDQRQANKTKDPVKIEAAKVREAEGLQRLTDARALAESAERETQFAMAVVDRPEPADQAVRIRGEIGEFGPVVPRGFLSVVTGEKTPKIDRAKSGRLELAEWIASRDNPLTARVMVNRVWQHLFGMGLVESADNFGLTGDAPSHPELLDYLAIRFMDEGWSVKRLIREIVLSRTYQQSDRRDESAYDVDPGNRLLWRFGRRRLEGEAIRDAILAASGTLDLHRPYGSLTLTVPNVELGSTAKILATNDAPRYRAVYLPMFRGSVPEMLALFDMADPSLVIGKREVTSVATQALYLMNSKFVMDQARQMAERIIEEASSDLGARVDLAYRLTLTRAPTETERNDILDYVRRAKAGEGDAARSETEAWTDVCHALFGSGEFLYVR